MTKPKTKKHRHRWLADEGCFSCGAYVAVCVDVDCRELGYFTGEGELKETRDHITYTITNNKK